MYLEISPRMTGKTTRLISEVKRYITKNPDHCVVIQSPQPAPHLSHFFTKDELTQIVLTKNRVNLDQKIANRFPLNTVIKNFYDEFDFLLGLTEVDLDGYYVTTARRHRSLPELCDKKSNDFLVKLLQHNEFKYQTHVAPIEYLGKSADEIYKSVNYYSVDTRNRELLGNFKTVA